MSVDISTKPLSKIARVLGHLITGASLNRFEAERIGDHCLNSTIAVLSNKYCLMLKRQPERVPNGWGDPCIATRYNLPESERQAANIAMLALTNRQSKGPNDAN